MLQGYEIIVFSDELGRHPFSCQHIMEYFFAFNRVIWITPTGMRNPKLSLFDAKRSLEKVIKWFSAGKPLPTRNRSDLVTISPPALPYNDVGMVRKINNYIVVSRVKKKLHERMPRIVITTLPITAEYVDAFHADLIVYYIVDDFMEWPGINQSYIAALEKMLLAKSHVLMASAEKLCKIKKGKVQSVYIPHGVNYEHFALSKSTKISDSLADMHHPIIGFFGAVSPWLDYNLIEKVASSRPEWSFVFIGPIDADITRFQVLNNIHFLGKVDYADLPPLAKQFDVGIIPFVVNDLTVSVNPLKLLEYFACGLPVVSTNLPEVRKFGPHVHVANDADEFVKCLEKVIRDMSQGCDERQRIARDNSWQSVAERFSRVIENSLVAL